MSEPERYPRAITPRGHVEPVPRRIRAELAGARILDSSGAWYLWDWPYYPRWQVPLADLTPGALHFAGDDLGRDHHGEFRRFDLRVGETVRPGAGRHYVRAEHPAIAGTVFLRWDAVDAWYEESEQVFVHPRSPYVRVDALRSRRHVRVELAGELLAESASPVLVFETGLPTRCYFERDDVALARLERSETVTACPYKGATSATWSVRAGGELHRDLAWSYDFPTRQLLPVAGLVAFYDEKVDVWVDGAPRPRPDTHFG